MDALNSLRRLTNSPQGYTVFSIPVGIVYRPNEAKVKNLKTKDYLGKARLVAASDRSNAFTGFTGSEIKKLANTATDDRPEDKLSFAATNLVKPELQSRARQQSEPPMNRNMFPPTPPPEADRSSASKNNDGQMSRAQSVRGGGPKPQPLSLGRAAFDQKERDDGPRRIGTTRSASERPPPSRQESMRNRGDRDRSRDRRERDRPRRRGSDDDADEYAEEVYDQYPSRGSRNGYTRSRQGKGSRQMYIEEEDEDDYEGSDFDDGEFEMMPRSKTTRRRSPVRSNTSSRRSDRDRERGDRDSGMKIRVKVHAGDTRYVFIDERKSMRDFVQQVREKFGIRPDFKIEIKDDGDMIAMVDDDDLEMAIQTAKSMARKENSDMPKMEVCLDLAHAAAQGFLLYLFSPPILILQF
jgi:hypothetical protein